MNDKSNRERCQWTIRCCRDFSNILRGHITRSSLDQRIFFNLYHMVAGKTVMVV